METNKKQFLFLSDFKIASRPFNEKVNQIISTTEEIMFENLIDALNTLESDHLKRLWVFPLFYVYLQNIELPNDRLVIPVILEKMLQDLDEIKHNSIGFQILLLKLTKEIPKLLNPMLKWVSFLKVENLSKITLLVEVLENINRINNYFISKFENFNELQIDRKKDLLFQLRYSVICREVFNFLLNDTCSVILQKIPSENPEPEIIEYLIFIIPVLISRVERSTKFLVKFGESLDEYHFKIYLQNLIDNSIKEDTIFELIFFRLDQVNDTEWIDDLCIYLIGTQYMKTDISYFIQFFERILHNRNIIISISVLSIIRQFSEPQKIRFASKIPDWLKEEDPFVNHVIPEIIYNLYQNHDEFFVNEWKSWYTITNERTWLEIIAQYIKPLYISPQDSAKQQRTQEQEKFLEIILKELEIKTIAKGLDTRIIYAGRRDTFGKILLLFMFLKLHISMPIQIDMIRKNLDTYACLVQLMDRDWFELKLSEKAITHFIFFFLSTENHFYLDHIESIISTVINNLDQNQIEHFQTKLRNSKDFFDTISELAILSLFLPYGVILRQLEYEFPNRKEIDFLLEKDSEKVLIEIFNIRPWGPIEHLPGVWLLPNLIKDATIKKYHRKGIRNINKSDLNGIPLLFGIDLTQSGSDLEDIDESIFGSVIYHRIHKDNEFILKPARNNDSIFHSKHVTDLVSGFIWIKQNYHTKFSFLINCAYLEAEIIPEWFKDVMEKNFAKFKE